MGNYHLRVRTLQRVEVEHPPLPSLEQPAALYPSVAHMLHIETINGQVRLQVNLVTEPDPYAVQTLPPELAKSPLQSGLGLPWKPLQGKQFQRFKKNSLSA